MTVTLEKASATAAAAPDKEEQEAPAAEDEPAPAAGWWAQARPYLPGPRIAAALCSGSLALSARAWEWATAGGWKAARGRLGGTALAVYVGYYEETHGQRWVLPLACGAWTLGALLHSRQADDADDQEHQGEDPEPQGEATEAEEPATAPVPRIDIELVARLARELAADDDAPNSRAVQLDDMLPHLCGLPKPALIAILTEAGVPVLPGVKYSWPGGRQRVRQGVRLEDLPPSPSPAATVHGELADPDGADAGPGQARDSPSPAPA